MEQVLWTTAISSPAFFSLLSYSVHGTPNVHVLMLRGTQLARDLLKLWEREKEGEERKEGKN